MTKRQRETLAIIGRYIAKHGRPPTYLETANALGVASRNAVVDKVDALVKFGMVTREANIARGIRLTKAGEAELRK